MTDLVDAARSVAPVVEGNAEAAEAEGTLPQSSVDAMVDAGLYAMGLPEEFGGTESRVDTMLRVYEEISRQDPSTGWCLMAVAVATTFAGAFLDDDAAKETFAGKTGVLHAGQFAPRGAAIAEGDGFRVTGEYSFGSGSGHAQWIAGGCVPTWDGEPRIDERGLPEMRAVFTPRDQVEFKGNWQVMGLRGTGSYDYSLTDVHVPEGFTFPLFADKPLRGSATGRLGVMTLTASGHAGWALGVARRALDEITALSETKQRLGQMPVRELPTFQMDLAKAEAKLRAARLLVFEVFGEADDAARSGAEVTKRMRAMARIATTYATDVGAEVMDFAHRSAGSDGIREGVMQRLFRDMKTGTQHLFVDEKTYIDAAQVLLGIDTPFTVV